MRRRRQQWLDGWERVAERHPLWSGLNDDERQRLGGIVEWMIRTKHWEEARGFSLTQEIVVAIAVPASLLILELDRRSYRDVRAIIVHPSTITTTGPRATTIRGVLTDGPRRVLGHTLDKRGPVVIAWDAIQRDLRNPHLGHNVVVHEFAHKLDAADGIFDGTPEIYDRPRRAEWVRVCTAELRRLQRSIEPDPVLRAYGAQNPSEFFAVATEAFFEQPLELAEHKPELYQVLSEYYRQDTVARARRSSLRSLFGFVPGRR